MGTRQKQRLSTRVGRWGLGISVVLILLGLDHHLQGLGIVGGGLLGLTIVACFAIELNNAWNGAVAPIPSPAQIEAELRAHGYEPTVADIAAVDQMYRARRNEHAALLGLGVAAYYVAQKNLGHR